TETVPAAVKRRTARAEKESVAVCGPFGRHGAVSGGEPRHSPPVRLAPETARSPGVKCVPHAVAHEVPGEDGTEDEEAGGENPRKLTQRGQVRPRAQHVAP